MSILARTYLYVQLPVMNYGIMSLSQAKGNVQVSIQFTFLIFLLRYILFL